MVLAGVAHRERALYSNHHMSVAGGVLIAHDRPGI